MTWLRIARYHLELSLIFASQSQVGSVQEDHVCMQPLNCHMQRACCVELSSWWCMGHTGSTIHCEIFERRELWFDLGSMDTRSLLSLVTVHRYAGYWHVHINAPIMGPIVWIICPWGPLAEWLSDHASRKKMWCSCPDPLCDSNGSLQASAPGCMQALKGFLHPLRSELLPLLPFFCLHVIL